MYRCFQTKQIQNNRFILYYFKLDDGVDEKYYHLFNNK